MARQISLVVGHNFLVASMVTLYHDCKQVNAAIDVFLVSLPVKYCDMLHRVVQYIIKHLFHEFLHFVTFLNIK